MRRVDGMTGVSPGNRYLEGNYAPLADEITADILPVTGHLPEALDGCFVRNGPNPVGVPEALTYRWLAAPAMVHGVALRGGRAGWYRNRWVRSAGAADALGERRRPGPRFEGADLAPNIGVVRFAGRTLALGEGGVRPHELDDELETRGPIDFDGTLPAGLSGHPVLDPATGELHAVADWWGWGEQVQHVVVGPDGRVRSTRFVPTTGSPMVHGTAVTARWTVVYDLPVRFDLGAAVAGDAVPYYWDASAPARVGLVPRAGGPVRWFEVEPCWVFHTMNAYDDGDAVVLDVVRWPRAFDRRHRGPGDGPAALWRWTLDTRRDTVREQLLDGRRQELPRIDERRTGCRHRFGYAVLSLPSAHGPDHGALVKHDLARGTSEQFDFGPGAGVSEAVFVPACPDAAEAHGWLLAYVHDPQRDRTDLVILDARNVPAGPVARVHLPRRVPHGLHAAWIPAGR